MIRNITIILVLCVGMFKPHFATAHNHLPGHELLEDYVDDLMTKTHNLLADESLDDNQTEKEVAKLLRQNMHLEWMAKQSLGRNIRNITKDQLKEFIYVYSNFVVESYSRLTNSYKGEKGVLLRIKEIRDNLYMVDTEVVSPSDGTVYSTKYLVHKITRDGKAQFLVGDVITEGVSILDSQRSEFHHVINERGIDYLINDLKLKVID